MGVCSLCGASGVEDLIGADGSRPCGSTPKCISLQKKSKEHLHRITASVTTLPNEVNEEVARYGKPLVEKDRDAVFVPAKGKRSPSLEQPIVAAVINPANPNALYGYDTKGDAIQRPNEDADRHRNLLSSPVFRDASVRCGKHFDQPAQDCPRCREAADQQRACDLAALAPKIEASPEKPVDAPSSEKPVDVFPTETEAEQLVRNLLKNFGLDKKAVPPQRKPIREREYHLREIFGVSREQIVEWLNDFRITYLNPPETIIVCDKETVMQEPDHTEFNRLQAEKIVALEAAKAEQERMLEELKQRQGDNGLTKRENTTLRKRYVAAIEKLEHEITQEKRAKPNGEPVQVERDIPGTEREGLRFSGRGLDLRWVEEYLMHYEDMTVGTGDYYLVENAAIIRAIDIGMFPHPFLEEYRAKYRPAFIIAEKLLDFGEHETLVEYAQHGEADSQSSGLSTHGRGTGVTDQRYHRRPLKTFDTFRRITGGSGSGDHGGSASHFGAPDYDQSDDTNE
jgi:hypothetical protein